MLGSRSGGLQRAASTFSTQAGPSQAKAKPSPAKPGRAEPDFLGSSTTIQMKYHLSRPSLSPSLSSSPIPSHPLLAASPALRLPRDDRIQSPPIRDPRSATRDPPSANASPCRCPASSECRRRCWLCWPCALPASSPTTTRRPSLRRPSFCRTTTRTRGPCCGGASCLQYVVPILASFPRRRDLTKKPIQNATASQTTYTIFCPTETPQACDLSLEFPFVVVEGPNTVEFHGTYTST